MAKITEDIKVHYQLTVKFTWPERIMLLIFMAGLVAAWFKFIF